MKIRAMAIYGVGALVLLFAYALISELVFDECGLSEAQARSVVLEELASRGLNAKYLSDPENHGGSCFYSYQFDGQDQKLNYVVMSTWLHGVKLSWWDYKREEEELAGKTLSSASPSTRQP